MTETALSLGEILFRLAIVFLLVFANGFFVAAEFALVGARRTRIDAIARTGNTRAKLAASAIQRLDHYISGTQLGITLSSLGLGWVGETTVAALIAQAFAGLPDPWSVISTHVVAGTIAFAFITFLHIVLGELAPKSVALLFPEATSMWTAGPLIAFSKLLTPFISLLNGTANLLLRTIGLQTPREAEKVHRPEELEMLLTQTYEHGLLREQPVEMIRSVFHLADFTAAEIMTPRTEMFALAANTPLPRASELVLASGHSRVPVFGENIDNVVGVVLARDLWRAERNGESDLTPLIRTVPFVPDSKRVEQLLRDMQRDQVQIAIVVDEFGGTAGLVTIEDVIEMIVGDIRDEYDVEGSMIQPAGDHSYIVAGSATLSEINETLGVDLPSEDYTTVGGYVMGMLGRIASETDLVEFPGGIITVTGVSGRRVERVRIDLQPVIEEVGDNDQE